MSLENRGMTQIQGNMENIETNAPEILDCSEVRVLIPYDPEIAHYNAAVIQSKNSEGEILIICREVPMEKRKQGLPDMGNLYIYRAPPGKEKAEKVKEFKLDHPDVINWEDARAHTSSKEEENENGEKFQEVSIGLTAIRSGDNKPVAATIKGEISSGNFSIKQESLLIYPNDEGKNVTPISDSLSLFRRNGEEGRHSLEVVEHSTDDKGNNKLNVRKIIKFPIKSWCEYQIGTQADMLPGGILPIHGVNKFELGINPKTGKMEDGYTYSLGFAQLDKDLNLIKMTDTPMYTRKSFKKVLPMGIEMDSNKDVVYCCGYSVDIVSGIAKIVINVGDVSTYEVSKEVSDIQKSLDQSSPINFEEIPKNLNELKAMLDKTPPIESEKIPDETTIFQKSA